MVVAVVVAIGIAVVTGIGVVVVDVVGGCRWLLLLL